MSWDCISFWIESHPGLSSWVQAVGSVGAILVAVFIASGQARRESKRARESDLIMLKSAIEIISKAAHAVEVLSEETSAGGRGGESKCHVESYCTTVEGLSLLALPDLRMIEPVVAAKTYLRVAAGMIPAATTNMNDESRRNARLAIFRAASQLRAAENKLIELKL